MIGGVMVDWQGRFTRGSEFHALSLQDLADGRDAYHVHLANLTNVVGTALGRYLIRRTDDDFESPQHDKNDNRGWSADARTLSNSGIRDWSWPCVLVFVSEWMKEPPSGRDADQAIPRRLYLPDGRQIPTCVVQTPLAVADRSLKTEYASIPAGPGLPLFTEAQDRQRVGTIGALVTDGSLVYAITSRHVLGAVGSPVYVWDRGEKVRIGETASVAANRSLQSLYPGIAGTRAELSLDAGLVALDSVEGWTTQMYGLGPVGDLVDVNVDTVALSLLGCPVRAFGGATGPMNGRILGLFHRWRSIGGVDQIAELMIGPPPLPDTGDDPKTSTSATGSGLVVQILRRPESLIDPDDETGIHGVDSRPGDSGTVWVWNPDREIDAEGGPMVMGILPVRRSWPPVHPLAIQWGGQVVLGPNGQQPTDYVLASTIAGVAQTLGVSLLHDDSLADHSLYWGKVGHYKVGGSACLLGKPGTKLAKLLEANLTRISVTDEIITSGMMPSANQREFVGLADVPDLVWRRSRKKDAANHFADMDEKGGDAANGRTLMQLWSRGEKWRTAAGWTEFYDSLPQPPLDKHRGALPFRVSQLYRVMVEAATTRDVTAYVAAAGVLAHYVGDACQPLHVSRLHHGEPDTAADDRVHNAYETSMLDTHSDLVVNGVNTALKGWFVGDDLLFTGDDQAANAVVDLMARTIKAIHPEEIVEIFTSSRGFARSKTMWDRLGRRTINRLADGSRTLAIIWRSAWEEGGGESIGVGQMVAQSKNALRGRYNDKSFAPSKWLREM